MLLAGLLLRFPAGEPSPGLATIAVLHDRPVEDVPGAPPELMAILRQALAADPAQRPPTAAALRDALAALDLPGSQPTPARHPTAASQPVPGQPPVSGGPAPVPYPGPARQASWVPGQAPAPQASWAADQAPAPQASWVPDQAPARPTSWASGHAPSRTSGPAPVGATPGRDMEVPGDLRLLEPGRAAGAQRARDGRHLTQLAGNSGWTQSARHSCLPARPGEQEVPPARPRAAHPARAGASQPGSYPGAGPIPRPAVAPIPHPGSGPGSHPGTGLVGQPGPAGPATQPLTVRRRPVALRAALSGGLVLVVVAALFAGAHFFAPGRTPGATQPRHGASAACRDGRRGRRVRGSDGDERMPGGVGGDVGGALPEQPGMLERDRGDRRRHDRAEPAVHRAARVGDVRDRHPAGRAASTSDAVIVAKDPTVRAVCSVSVLLRSRAGAARKIPAASWDIEVVPPDEAAYDSGARAYRCLAHVLTGPIRPSPSSSGNRKRPGQRAPAPAATPRRMRELTA